MSSRMSEMSGQNPFTLSFGRKPEQYIARLVQTEEIVQDFLQDRPSSQVYMITGVRGSGKTVAGKGAAGVFASQIRGVCFIQDVRGINFRGRCMGTILLFSSCRLRKQRQSV